MAFKLKLKVPQATSDGASSSSKVSKPSKSSKSSKSSSGSGGPKLKLKLPDSSSSSKPLIPKLKIKNPSPEVKVKKEKSSSSSSSSSSTAPTKKLKISLVRKDEGKTNNVKLKLPLKGASSNISGSNPAKTTSSIPELIQPTTRSVPKVRIKPTRVPGDGYDSEAPDLEDDPLLEQGIVIRFLDDVNLDLVHNAVDLGDLTDINVKWITKDKAIVNVKSTLYSAVLLDLPTLTEIYKTIDKKNIFKTVDVCQILLVLRVIDPKDLNMERDFDLNQDKLFVHPVYKIPNTELRASKQVYKDGLIYPFEDVHRRFRPRMLDHRVLEDIQLKVDELIKLDNDAEEVHFEVLDLKKNQKVAQNLHGYDLSNISTPKGDTASPSPFVGAGPEDVEMGEAEDEDEIEDPDLEEELAKALEDDPDGDDDDDDDDDEEDGDGVEEEEVEVELNGAQPETVELEVHEGEDEVDVDVEEDDDDEDDDDEDDEDDDEDDEAEDGVQDNGAKAEKQHAKLLEEEIADLEKVVEKHRIGLETATQKMMRMKFQTSYRTLKASLDTKKAELAKILNENQPKSQSGAYGDDEEDDEGDENNDNENEIEIENEDEDENENENENENDNDNDNENGNDNDNDSDDNADDIDDLF